MNIHETYVSIESAELLKKAGFDWEVMLGKHLWESRYRDSITGENFNTHELVVSIPTLSVAQKWLREVKKLSVEMRFCFLGFAVHEWCCKIHSLINDEEIVSVYKEAYEEALEAGIKKCLEIILEKK